MIVLNDTKAIKLFGDKEIRTVWDKDLEEWYFSIVDVCEALTDSVVPRRYWSDLKIKLKAEGSELYENIVQFKMLAEDGKMRLTDVADTKQLLRLIQSIPSPKAEPFKQWLAQVGSDRLDETADPELAIDRALLMYKKKGYSEKWINQRLKSIEFRKDLTDEWDRVGVKNQEYAILTNEITKAWADMTTGEYKAHKGLKKESLRDNMTNTELVLNMLAELSTTEISKTVDPKTLSESKQVAKQGGTVAKNARLELEQKTGRKAISKTTAKNKNELDK
ncbi:MAG: Bro-N domain-containing protein [Hydrogenoanaerobacterium sp.]